MQSSQQLPVMQFLFFFILNAIVIDFGPIIKKHTKRRVIQKDYNSNRTVNLWIRFSFSSIFLHFHTRNLKLQRRFKIWIDSTTYEVVGLDVDNWGIDRKCQVGIVGLVEVEVAVVVQVECIHELKIQF